MLKPKVLIKTEIRDRKKMLGDWKGASEEMKEYWRKRNARTITQDNFTQEQLI